MIRHCCCTSTEYNRYAICVSYEACHTCTRVCLIAVADQLLCVHEYYSRTVTVLSVHPDLSARPRVPVSLRSPPHTLRVRCAVRMFEGDTSTAVVITAEYFVVF